MAQVMKVKFLKKGYLLEAKLADQPSYLWRSLCSVIDLVKTYMYWRVDNGHKAKLWRDKWIPFHLLPPNQIPNPFAN